MSDNRAAESACCDPSLFERGVTVPPPEQREDDGSSGAGSDSGEGRVGRRRLLRGAAAIGVAAAAGGASGLLGAATPAEAHGTLHQESASAAAPAMHGRNTGGGGTGAAPAVGVLGDVSPPAAPADIGVGVQGIVPGSGNGVLGIQQPLDAAGTGSTDRLGIAVQGIGCCGVAGIKPSWTSTVGAGVFGVAHRTGVTPPTPASVGVLATKENPVLPAQGTPPNTGVYGAAFVAGGAGIVARAPTNADALRVHGRALFSSAGAGVVAQNARSGGVVDGTVSEKSHVTVTLTGDPGNQASVAWVQRHPGLGFMLHLDRPAAAETPFTYFIVEPV